MAKTGAERQAAYRARHAIEESGQRRISTWISTDAALALETMAHRYGVTMREVIEMLLLRDHDASDNSPINKEFLAKRKPRTKRALPSNEPFHIASIGTLPVEELLRNEKEPSRRNSGVSLLHNDDEGRTPAEIDTTPEPPRGGQYSLEL